MCGFGYVTLLSVSQARGVTPYNALYNEAPPEGVPYSGLRYMKG